MSSFRISRPYALLLYLAAATISAVAQQTATLSGTVHDTSGGVIESATVKASNVHTGEAFTGITTGNGLYTIPLIKPGEYEFIIAVPPDGTSARDRNYGARRRDARSGTGR